MATSKIAVTEGSGKNIATNSVSEDAVTKELQRVVLNTNAGVEVAPLTDTQLRATAVPVSGPLTDTQLRATAVPVSLASVPSHAVTNAGTFATQVDGAALTALQLIDNIVSGTGANVSQLGGAAVPIGAGLEATAVRVTLPTDGTGKVTAVSGTAANMKVEATIASAQTLATVTNLAQLGGAAVPIGAGLEATAVRVTLPTDGTGKVTAVSPTAANMKVEATIAGAQTLATVTTVGTVSAVSALTCAAANAKFDVGLINGVTPLMGAGNTGTGSLRVTIATDQVVIPTKDQAATSGGWAPYKLISAASTNATNVKASAGQIGYLYVSNINAAVRYLKLYNKASAPTVGTDTPVFVAMIPAGGGATISVPAGIVFSTGIAFAMTTGAADNDTGAVAAAEVIVNMGYL